MRIKCCHGCEPPKRNAYCHTYCEEYKEQKAAGDAEREARNKIHTTASNIKSQRDAAVHKAYKKWRVH